MNVQARVANSNGEHHITLATNGNTHTIVIPPKSSGQGSSANGGELLFLALATCYCNDIYREAAKIGIKVEHVEVEVNGQFGEEGSSANNVTYSARIVAQATKVEIEELARHTDTVAEIQNSLRAAIPITLAQIDAVTAQA